MAKLQNWSPDDWGEGNIRKRPYQNKKDYLDNQKGAFAKRQKAIARFSRDVKRFTDNFRDMTFADLTGKKLLSLGCRTGAEVKAFRNLGVHAYGVDIEPVHCDEEISNYIQQGDFHDLPYETGSFDATYTNSFDHVFDLDKAVNEVKRILRPDSLFILDVVAGYEEGGHPGDHEAMYWARSEDFVTEVEKYGFKRTQELRNVPNVKGLPFIRGILKRD